jgi:hypothetical protein
MKKFMRCYLHPTVTRAYLSQYLFERRMFRAKVTEINEPYVSFPQDRFGKSYRFLGKKRSVYSYGQ